MFNNISILKQRLRLKMKLYLNNIISNNQDKAKIFNKTVK